MNATPRFSVVVVFATPPFWFANAITRVPVTPGAGACGTTMGTEDDGCRDDGRRRLFEDGYVLERGHLGGGVEARLDLAHVDLEVDVEVGLDGRVSGPRGRPRQ